MCLCVERVCVCVCVCVRVRLCMYELFVYGKGIAYVQYNTLQAKTDEPKKRMNRKENKVPNFSSLYLCKIIEFKPKFGFG